jgi:carboxymethylenebutenolidase
MTPLSVHPPSGAPRGGIIVVQEAFGVNTHIEEVCARLAHEGWLVVAPHLFHRSGDPQFGYDDFTVIRSHMADLTAEGIMEDIDAGIDHLEAAGIERSMIGIVGFCMGGTVALVVGARRDIGAAITYYGGGLAEGRFGFPPLIEEATRLQVPWLGVFGDLDTGIPVADVEQLRGAAASSGQVTELVRYAEAEHGFNCDQRPSYHQSSAHSAWQMSLAWFSAHLQTAADQPAAE